MLQGNKPGISVKPNKSDRPNKGNKPDKPNKNGKQSQLNTNDFRSDTDMTGDGGAVFVPIWSVAAPAAYGEVDL